MLCEVQAAFFLSEMTMAPYLFSSLISEFSKVFEFSLATFSGPISHELSRGGECSKSPIVGCLTFRFKLDLEN